MSAPLLLSLTALRVTDLVRSAEFYEQCGFVRERSFATGTFDAVILRAGASGIELIAPHGDPAPVEHGSMFTKLVCNTDDVAGVMRAACARGGTAEMPPTARAEFAGRTIGTVRDPDGYLIEFVSPAAQPAR
ncbi:VOC family protein [Nocardia neocaledoniensis]|uniref:VOC family protein n=1 Tax=Nocardia neocaledoniensis TaxID=236511 RepID=UPI002454AF06|nr:VOC family protein [Nocardia neocaledoniensis]